MSSTELAPFPVYTLDNHRWEHAFSKVGPAIDGQDYKQAVEQATAALNKVQECVVLTILSHRSYAFEMQGKFNEAVQDAQEMIAYIPTFAIGYLRLGEIYRSQGKQHSAIRAYDMGIQSVSVSHPYYPQLVDGRAAAVNRSETRIDFVSRLPVEMVDDILMMIPTSSIPNCLNVSSAWRNKTFNCPHMWNSLRTSSGTRDDWTTGIVSHIARNVETLTIDTISAHVFIRYIRTINSGRFTRIKTLALNGEATKHIDTNRIMEIAGVFWKIHSTLTKLVVEFNQSSAIITPGNLLSICTHLKSLEYSTTNRLSDVINERSPLGPHNNLVDMRLKASSITKQDLEKMHPSCQYLRRLLLNGCDTTVLETVDTVCPNLESFGYNAECSTVPLLNNLNTKRLTRGLQRLYTYNGGTGIPVSAILPLLKRNMRSLRVLYINLSAEGHAKKVLKMYSNMELQKLNQLTFWGDERGVVQPMILRSIATCTVLTHFAVVSSRDIRSLAKELYILPQMEQLEISHPRLADVGGAEEKLIRLFERYTRNIYFGQRLKYILLRYCKSMLTDHVLTALAGIRTLENIWLAGSSDVSEDGLDNFFMTLCDKVSKIRLTEMDIVTERSLVMIADSIKTLEHLVLENLKNFSDHAVKYLVDRTPKLQSLTIVKCEFVTEAAIAHAKRKVQAVVFIQ